MKRCGTGTGRGVDIVLTFTQYGQANHSSLMKVFEMLKPFSHLPIHATNMLSGQTRALSEIHMCTPLGRMRHGSRRSGRKEVERAVRRSRTCCSSLCGLLRIAVCNFGDQEWDLSITSLVRVSMHFDPATLIHFLIHCVRRSLSLIGSFFGGTPSTISWWRDLYFTYHDHYLSQGVFVGKDQTLINALFLLNPKRIISVWLLDPLPPPSQPGTDKPALSPPSIKRSLFGTGKDTPLGACGSTWYYYQFFLASAEERVKMRHMWGHSWGFKPWSWDWWQVSTCRWIRVIALLIY